MSTSMKALGCVVVLLFSLAGGNILQLDRWPILETLAKDELNLLFNDLREFVFPMYKHEFEGFLFPNTLLISNFRILELAPRFVFMEPTFYTEPDDGTYGVNMPLGFRIKSEFIWFFNWFILPMSGRGTFETDVHEFAYNTTLNFSDPEVIVRTNMTYELMPVTEFDNERWVGIDELFDVPEKIIQAIENYYPYMQKNIAAALQRVLPTHIAKHIRQQIKLSLYYPTFHLVYSFELKITKISTRNSLLLVYGETESLPSAISAGEDVSRQYCIDEGLLNTVVSGVWPKMKGVYRKGDLPSDATYQLTVKGVGQLLPDVLLEYHKDDEVVLSLKNPDQTPKVTLGKLDDEHGIVKGFKMQLSFAVKGDEVMALDVGFDIVVTPTSVRRNKGFAFNLRTTEATVTPEAVVVVRKKTGYNTVIMSNVMAACKEFLDWLILPFMGNALLGDGLVLADEITPYCIAEYTVAQTVICLNLIKIL